MMVDQHVYLYKNRWAVKAAERVIPEFVFNSNEAAKAYAQYAAKRNGGRVVHFDSLGNVDHIEDFSSTQSLSRNQ